MRIAVGPFPNTAHDQWPVFGAEELAPEFEIVPFLKGEKPPDAAATIHWSPEYNLTAGFITGYRVVMYGDHHVVPFEKHRSLLETCDLIATDYRGVKRLQEMGLGDKAIWFRAFAHDPRIHTPTPTVERDLDWAFMGRRDGGKRDALLDGLYAEWCKRYSDRRFCLDFGPFTRGKEAEIYRRAKTVVGFSQRGELQMRAYEAMVCGALYVCQHDTDEIWQTHAPIPTYEPTLLADFLDAWLENDAAREAKVKAQWEWCQTERPQDHLRFLCRAIKERMVMAQVRPEWATAGHDVVERDLAEPNKERMEHGSRSVVSVAGRDRGRTPDPDGLRVDQVDKERMGNVGRSAVSSDSATRDHGVSAGGETGNAQAQVDPPTKDEQRLECVALVPPTAKRIIDLGTNLGGVGWAIKQRTPDSYVVGVDLDERATEIASQRMDEFHVFNLTAEHAEWEKQSWYQEGGYDCVLMLDIVEHVLENARLLESAKRLLAPDGVIVASIPQVRSGPLLYRLAALGRWEYFNHAAPHRAWAGPVDNVLADAHVRFFCQRDIEQLFLSVGMTIQDWSVSLMDARGLEQWTQDLADLIGKHAGAAQRADFLASSNVIQFIFRAERPRLTS